MKTTTTAAWVRAVSGNTRELPSSGVRLKAGATSPTSSVPEDDAESSRMRVARLSNQRYCSARNEQVTVPIRFGEFVLNPARRELRRRDRRVPLSPKGLQLLELLLDHRLPKPAEGAESSEVLRAAKASLKARLSLTLP
jgi:hypothetical protein